MNKRQKAAIGASIAGAMLLGGAIGATALSSASAATDTPSDTSTAAPDDRSGHGPGHHDGIGPERDDSAGGHVGRDGTAETLLTRDTAARVTAAVTAKYPDAEIQRVENDAEGAAYEAHIIQSDGTRATVKLDKSFSITSTETGHGHGPGHDDDTDDADDTADTESGS